MFLALFSFILLPAESAQARELRLGAYKYLSDADMKKLLQPFTAFLSKSLNAPVKLYITSTYSELSQRFISGELDMAIIPPYAYVKLADKIKLKLLASMKLEGNYYYNGIIAVKKDSGINSLADFKGRKFAYVSPDSASGYLYPRILFKKTGLNPDALFKETQFTASHFDSVKALINGSVDGIAVFKDSINFAKMQGLDISGLKILEQTENIPHEAFVTQYNMNDTFAKKIQEALTRFK
jgi:phosphonate transport system substrate-binding protein